MTRPRPVQARLLDTPPRSRRGRRGLCEAVELSPTRNVCPVCAFTLMPVRWAQAALLWMHGHGGTSVRTDLRCSRCGYGRHQLTETITPRAPRGGNVR